MPAQPEKFLLPEDDGLPMRESGEYARDKLAAIEIYLRMALTATKNGNWRERYYLDLESGPGKNRFEKAPEVLLGSPLIALTMNDSFSKFRFNDIDPNVKNDLSKRINVSPIADRVRITTDDINNIVNDICEEIETVDSQYRPGIWSTFNIAVLDPKGLELQWKTVERLAQVNRMDLIINFFTSSIRRNYGAGNYGVVDAFFGTSEWREIYETNSNRAMRRQALIRLYLKRLHQFGYVTSTDDEISQKDIPIKNSNNAEIYTLIFASKHPLGEKLWRQAAKIIKPDQTQLPGFDDL